MNMTMQVDDGNHGRHNHGHNDGDPRDKNNDCGNDVTVPVPVLLNPVPAEQLQHVPCVKQQHARQRRRRHQSRQRQNRHPEFSRNPPSSMMMGMVMMMVCLVVVTLTTLQETVTLPLPGGRHGSDGTYTFVAAAAVVVAAAADEVEAPSTSKSTSSEVQKLAPGSDTPSSSSGLLAPSNIPGEKEKSVIKKFANKIMMTVTGGFLWVGTNSKAATAIAEGGSSSSSRRRRSRSKIAVVGHKEDRIRLDVEDNDVGGSSSSSSSSRSIAPVRNEKRKTVQEQRLLSTRGHDIEKTRGKKSRRRTTTSPPSERISGSDGEDDHDGDDNGIQIMVLGRKMKGLVRIMLWRIACLSSWVRTTVMVIELLLASIEFLEHRQEERCVLSATTTTNLPSDDTVDDLSAAAAAASPFAAAGAYTNHTLRCFRDRALYIHTTLTTYLADYSSYLYNQLLLVDIYNDTDYNEHANENVFFSVSSTNRIDIPAERDTVSNWTSQFWSNLTKGWSKMVDKIHLQSLLLLNSTNTSNEIATAGSRRNININKHIRKYWSVVSVSISRQTVSVIHFVKRVWPKVTHRIVSFVKVVSTRLNHGTRVPRRYVVRKWRETKSFVVKNTKKLLLRIVNGLDRFAVIGSDKVGRIEGRRPKEQTTAAVQKEEKASYFASVGIVQPTTPVPSTSPVPEVSNQIQSSTTASTKKTSANPTLSGGAKKTKTTSNGKSTTDLSSKPSIMDQLTGALSPKKSKESQVIPEEVDAEPNVLAGMFSSLASWGLYAAGGAAVVGYVVYNQYDSWVGGTKSHSSSESMGTETDDIVTMEVDIVSTEISSTTPTTRRMSTRRMTTRGMAEITPDNTM